MAELLGAHIGVARESTELQRRKAFWMFPAVVLLHGIWVRGIAPDLQVLNLCVAAAALPFGVAFRSMQRATSVIAVMIGFSAFTFLWMFGIAAPLTFLGLAGLQPLLLWVGLMLAAVLGTFVWIRVRVSLRREWSKPLEQVEGVQIAQDGTLWREFGKAPNSVFNTVAVLVIVAIVPLLLLSRGHRAYQMLALVAGPLCLALMCADGVARWIAFYVAVRRWEAEHHVRLHFPPLPWRANR
ncbi:MAG TPA: hypothetical protein VJR89_16910 [Polyangiales bacterium]|nr:hypothetical protein [Polyangiales bacterium]